MEGMRKQIDPWRKQFRNNRTFNALTGSISYIRLNFFSLTLFAKKFLHDIEYMKI